MAYLGDFYINAFRAYERRFFHDFGEFLSHYLGYWRRANDHGVTHYEGIMRLLVLLPEEWQGWAREQSMYYIFRDPVTMTLLGNFPNFMGVIHFRYIVYEHPPPGPYVHVPEYQMLQIFEDGAPDVDLQPAADLPQEPLVEAEPEPEHIPDPVQELLVDPGLIQGIPEEPQAEVPPPDEPVVAPPVQDVAVAADIPPPPEHEQEVDQPPPRRRRISASGSYVRVPIRIISDSETSSGYSLRGDSVETEPSEDTEESSAGPQAS